MRFSPEPELVLFAESVRAALGSFEPPLEPVFGTWWDERDDALGQRLEEVGWAALWDDPALLAAAVAGGVELGRAVAPLCLLDEATLGVPLAVEGRVRHGEGRVAGGVREPTLDGTGTLREVETALPDDAARLRAWGVATLAYLAGIADAALAKGVEHAMSREQFGAPLASLPAVQAHLADAALARDGLLLCAWESASPGAAFPHDALAWAGGACRAVTGHVQQVHGGVGFALEGGVHRFHRRAKTVQAWTDAVLRTVGAASSA